MLTTVDKKTAKIIKKVILLSVTLTSGDVIVGSITLLVILAFFYLSLLALQSFIFIFVKIVNTTLQQSVMFMMIVNG